MINDKELLAMIRDPKTQREGFAVLVSQYSEPLYWKVRHIVLDHDDADDVLQNAFVKAWTNLDSFQGKSSLSTWLYRIAINEALDFLRRKKQMVNISTEDEPGLASRLLADDYFDGEISILIIDSNYRGKGIGKKCFQKYLNMLKMII